MPIWQNSKMSSVYFSDAESSENYDCVVKIENGKILVEYQDEGIVQYEGTENGAGHFQLSCPTLSAKATLHMFADSEIMEGSWAEEGDRGMWKIKLA